MKRFVLAIAALIWPSLAFSQLALTGVGGPSPGTTTTVLISGGSNDSGLTNTATAFLPIAAGYSAGYTATFAGSQQAVAVTGSIYRLNVQLITQNTAGASTSWTVQLQIAAVATPLTCTIGNNASTCDDLQHQAVVTAGDRIAWAIIPANTPTAQTPPPGIFVTALFNPNQGTTPNRTPIFMNSSTTSSNSANRWIGPGQLPPEATTEAKVSGIVPIAGTIQALYGVSSASVSPGSYALTAVKNGTNQSMTCTISATTCSTTSNTFSVSAGDTISCLLAPSSTPTARIISCGFALNPTTNGQAALFANDVTTPPTVNATRYYNISGTAVSGATESTFNQLAPLLANTPRTIVFGNLYAAQSAVTATAGRTVTLRSAGASPGSGPSCTMGIGASTCNDTSNTFTLDNSSQPVLDMQTVDTGDTGSALTWFKSSVSTTVQ